MFENSALMIFVAAGLLLVLGFGAVAWAFLEKRKAQRVIRSRLKVPDLEDAVEDDDDVSSPDEANDLAELAARKAAEFYASSDAENVVRLRQKLMRAGFLDPEAVGKYFLARFVGLVLGAILGAGLAVFLEYGLLTTQGVTIVGASLLFGYMLPAMYLHQIVSKRTAEYRNGFPDFMDLMIVCCDAGLSIEASVDRVTREIRGAYPALSSNLTLVTLELRAGRSLDETLKALAERLGIDEVRAFATLLRQSKELGTSLSQTLKVFSDEMRHKRMTVAEEKAHSLPAKMTIPVTMFILPTVLLIAIIPTIVTMMLGD
ncbi:MAG: type II secretion system F family protein [Pseudomonadota bacterium]